MHIDLLFTVEFMLYARKQQDICPQINSINPDTIWQITNRVQIWTDTPKTDSKTIHHRVTEGTEKSFVLLHATGAVNKVKLCVLCDSVVKYFLVFDCQAV